MTPGRRARCCRERNLVAKESSVRATRPQVLAASVSVIRRRHVFYVAGYDPRGATRYYDLFRPQCRDRDSPIHRLMDDMVVSPTENERSHDNDRQRAG
jgi:hypothetical protein